MAPASQAYQAVQRCDRPSIRALARSLHLPHFAGPSSLNAARATRAPGKSRPSLRMTRFSASHLGSCRQPPLETANSPVHTVGAPLLHPCRPTLVPLDRPLPQILCSRPTSVFMLLQDPRFVPRPLGLLQLSSSTSHPRETLASIGRGRPRTDQGGDQLFDHHRPLYSRVSMIETRRQTSGRSLSRLGSM